MRWVVLRRDEGSFGLRARRDGVPLQWSSMRGGMGTLGARSLASHILDSHTAPIPLEFFLCLGRISA